MLLAKLHHDVEEVHRVEVQLVAQAHLGLHIAEILVGSNLLDDFEHNLLNVVLGHFEIGMWGSNTVEALHDKRGVDPQHAEGIVEDGTNPAVFPWLIHDERG